MLIVFQVLTKMALSFCICRNPTTIFNWDKKILKKNWFKTSQQASRECFNLNKKKDHNRQNDERNNRQINLLQTIHLSLSIMKNNKKKHIKFQEFKNSLFTRNSQTSLSSSSSQQNQNNFWSDIFSYVLYDTGRQSA